MTDMQKSEGAILNVTNFFVVVLFAEL